MAAGGGAPGLASELKADGRHRGSPHAPGVNSAENGSPQGQRASTTEGARAVGQELGSAEAIPQVQL